MLQRRSGKPAARNSCELGLRIALGSLCTSRILRRRRAWLGAFLVATAIAASCSRPARYRVLSFFFDGVPDPCAPAESDVQAEGATTGTDGETTVVPAKPAFYNHPPYWENRCGTCHDINGGGIFRSPEEGLCQACHSDLPGDARYVHGPVAVSSCLVCHHYHRSPYPKVLLEDPADICAGCHKPADLTDGAYHASVEDRVCIDCHDPHAGENRFFVKDGAH